MKRSRDDDLPNEHNGPEEQQDKVRKTDEITEQPRREGEEQPPQFEVPIPPQIHPNVPRPLPQEKLPVAPVQMRHPQVGAPMVSFAHLTTTGIPPPFQPGPLLGQTGPGQPMPLPLPRQPTPKPSPQVGPTVNSNAMEGGIVPTLPTVQLTPPKLSHISPTPPIVPPGVTPQIPGPLAGAAPQPATAYRQVKFENALDFLDQVKLKFQNRPEVYNRFLDIMKDFKAQCIDTPGVIARVSELFKGHKSLILGFNTFLPPGYKIEYVPDDDTVKEQPSTVPVPSQTGPISSQPGSPTGPPPVVETKPTVVPNTVSSNSNSQANAATQRKQPEFDHARNYVKKIKMRFALQPNIYKAFLEILHTYHKEQHTIKDVYEQVANLFRNHQDLLDEFTQFLPDPVASQPPIIGGSQQQKKKQTRKPKAEKPVAPVAAPVTRKKEKPQEEALPKLTTGEQFNDTYEELNFFYRLKQRINNPNLYYEFLKCLNLFSQGIVSRLELVLLAKDLLARHRDLYEWFQQFIGFDDPAVSDFLEKHDDKPSPTKLPEIDFKTCKRYGPSYRALPKNYIPPVCSGRTELCNSVLNDTWVSVPTGSEDYGFKNLRKNQYEEMLFKCEDDRFELDLVIELNASTVRALEPVLKNIQEMSEEEASKFRLDTALDAVLHIRSIERIYGEKGPEVIDALYNNPAGTIPVVLNRLRQKDQEWTKARREWNKIWREVNEKNYYKSLDHQSFYFKQNDKKNLSSKILVAEIKQRYHEKLRELDKEKKKGEGKEDKMEEDGGEEKVVRDRTGRGPKEEEDEEIDATIKFEYKVDKEDIGKPYHLKYKMDDQVVFNHIVELVRSSPDKNLSRHDREKIDTFFKHFVKEFFFLDELTFPEIKKGENETNGEGSAEEKTPKLNTVEKMDVESTASSKPEGTKGANVFFGNTSFYVFLRLLQVLYDRLHKARELSLNPHTNSNFAFLMNPTKSTKEDDGDRYKSFKRILGSFISGGKDQTQYEDDCRALFGIQAYVLFTLDRVVQQLTKQLQALLAEEKDSKLLAMFTLNSQSSDEQMYHSDVARLLEDERCFRFEYEKGPNRGIFTIQLLDSYQNPPMYVDISSEEKMERWSHYVENYIGSEESSLDNKKHNVFLQRNVVKKGKGAVDMHNGLECRICISSFRLFYVENTEDYMYRRGKLSKSRKFVEKKNIVQSKQKHLNEILNKKFGPITTTEPVFV